MWWAAAMFVLLIAYLGWLDGGTLLRRLPAVEPWQLSDEETRQFLRTSSHVGFVTAIASVVSALCWGLKIYWALLIGAGAAWIMLMITGLVASFPWTAKKT
jgi:hypothetical protein